ncbi:phage holin, LLH family [Paenibacillus sp. GbtcB18]|uniref:phage holin, LLH family n=1 Tax=Paenibacillus sp. GbtcB18 TaxID=2824763 RepID=UPI001C3008F9|nr:phage holin, LLH family [Paenibacillus sp. GbtcB18]
MSEQIADMLKPLLLAVIMAVVGILGVAINVIKDRAIKWLQAHTNAAQQDLIAKIAQEAFAFAEKQGAFTDGKQKMEEAIDYAAKELQRRGINVDRQKLLATIEAAWMQYNSSQKPAVEVKTVNAQIEARDSM